MYCLQNRKQKKQWAINKCNKKQRNNVLHKNNNSSSNKMNKEITNAVHIIDRDAAVANNVAKR
jgi:hypothetical protein